MPRNTYTIHCNVMDTKLIILKHYSCFIENIYLS